MMLQSCRDERRFVGTKAKRPGCEPERFSNTEDESGLRGRFPHSTPSQTNHSTRGNPEGVESATRAAKSREL